MHFKKAIGIAAMAIGAAALPASAAVVYAHNGIILNGFTGAAYVGATHTDFVVDGGGVFIEPSEPPYLLRRVTVGSRVDDFTPATTSHPASDRISAKSYMSYTLGEGFGADSIDFQVLLASDPGAQSAFNSVGEQADAKVHAEGRVVFSVDGSYAGGLGLPSGTIIGTMSLPALAALGAFTTFSGSVMAYGEGYDPTGTEVISFSSSTGFAGSAFDLHTGASYEILLRFEMVVPHGTVPSSGFAPGVDFNYAAAITAVPAPAALALVGLAGVRSRRRR